MVYLGADHGGFELKEKIKSWLSHWGYIFEDCGNTVYDKEDDYPDFAFRVAKKVAFSTDSKGVLVCRSAAGMVIAANKARGVRAVSVFNAEMAKHSREHNDANIIGLSADFSTEIELKNILKVWLETPFSNEGRHKRRIEKIRVYEDNK